MLQPGELHLQLAFAGLRALREDLEDELPAVEDAPVELLLQIALLRGRELVVEHHERGVDGRRGAPDLLDLPGAGIQARIGAAAAALDDFQVLDARALDEANDFFDGLPVAVLAEIEADDDRCLRVYSGSLSAPRLMGRAGTTVEIACL